MDSIVLKVDGMTCNHCVRAVKGVLETVPGVSAVEVSLAAGTAAVVGSADVATLVAAVAGEGYAVARIG